MQTLESETGAAQSYTTDFLSDLCYDLYHCGRDVMITLKISCSIFSLHTTEGESEICPISSASEP